MIWKKKKLETPMQIELNTEHSSHQKAMDNNNNKIMAASKIVENEKRKKERERK